MFSLGHRSGTESLTGRFVADDPTCPLLELLSPSQLVSCEYNPREVTLLAGGCHNGQVCYWDDRAGGRPVGVVGRASAHSGPVCSTKWVSSKTAAEFFTASSDGRVSGTVYSNSQIIADTGNLLTQRSSYLQTLIYCSKILWWDIRQLSQPSDVLTMEEAGEGEEGATVLEYEWTIPAKFMVGTQRGEVFSCNKKNKGKERISAVYRAHYGPVCALQRNPAFPKVKIRHGQSTSFFSKS